MPPIAEQTSRIAFAASVLLVAAGLAGCAASQEAHSPRQAGLWKIEPLHAPEPAPEPAPPLAPGAGAWVASTGWIAPGEAIAARRDSGLIARPPAPLVDASVWPGPPVPLELRRIPTIYSRWGTRH